MLLGSPCTLRERATKRIKTRLPQTTHWFQKKKKKKGGGVTENKTQKSPNPLWCHENPVQRSRKKTKKKEVKKKKEEKEKTKKKTDSVR